MNKSTTIVKASSEKYTELVNIIIISTTICGIIRRLRLFVPDF